MSATEPAVEPMPREEMLEAIKKQVEFYFSKENLSADPHLVSQMNESYFVPLSVILGFKKITQLTSNMEDLIEAIKDSPSVILNENQTMIKPNIKLERKTIILRDIASDVPKEEIEELFKGLGTIESLKSDVGNTWFLTMDSEDTAVNALLELKNRKFRDQAVKARLKSENLLRTIYKPTMVPPMIPAMNANMTEGINPVAPAPFFPPYPKSNGFYGIPPYFPYPTQNQEKNPKKHSKGHKKGGKHEEREKENIAIIIPQAQSSVHFPPLIPTGTNQQDMCTNGYNNKPFKKYSNDDILDIVRKMSDLSIPSTIEAGDHSEVLVEANPELVEKGRTMSIDQALSHGRPRTLSVDSVDYTCMVYGNQEDEVLEQVRKQRKGKKHTKPYAAVVMNGIPNEGAKEAPKTEKEGKPVAKSAPKDTKKDNKESKPKNNNRQPHRNNNNNKGKKEEKKADKPKN
ncbi:hypothetical protein WA158_004979 [Blastocystis sp. Blastoise]